jgi:hypothetical protein
MSAAMILMASGDCMAEPAPIRSASGGEDEDGDDRDHEDRAHAEDARPHELFHVVAAVQVQLGKVEDRHLGHDTDNHGHPLYQNLSFLRCYRVVTRSRRRTAVAFSTLGISQRAWCSYPS